MDYFHNILRAINGSVNYLTAEIKSFCRLFCTVIQPLFFASSMKYFLISSIFLPEYTLLSPRFSSLFFMTYGLASTNTSKGIYNSPSNITFSYLNLEYTNASRCHRSTRTTYASELHISSPTSSLFKWNSSSISNSIFSPSRNAFII